MKKRSNQTKIPKSKIIFFSTIFFALGIFILFFSFLMGMPKGVDIEVISEEQPTPPVYQESVEDVKEPPVVALAPKPDPIEPAIDKPKDPSIVDSKPDITKPSSVSPPEKTKDGQLIFIFDDGGHQTSHSKSFVDLPFPITIAVLPKLADSVETANLVRNSGNELFLHQPMQAMNLNLSPGPGAILPAMTTGEAAAVVRKNLSELGKVDGMNNHEGSLITSDRNLMGAVLDVCDDYGIFFLDSRTTAQTAVPMVALERGIEVLDRDVFIDNEKDKAYMREMIKKGLEIADKQGYAIMIGHVTTPLLAPLLNEMYDDLSAQGYTFTTPSKLKL